MTQHDTRVDAAIELLQERGVGLEGARVDAALAKMLGFSRTFAAEVAESGGVASGGRSLGKSDRLESGMWLDVTWQDKREPEVVPVAVPDLGIVFEDDDIVRAGAVDAASWTHGSRACCSANEHVTAPYSASSAATSFARRSRESAGGGAERLSRVRGQMTLPLFPGNITATPLPKWGLSLGGCPVTSPSWPGVRVSPFGYVWLSPV